MTLNPVFLCRPELQLETFVVKYVLLTVPLLFVFIWIKQLFKQALD